MCFVRSFESFNSELILFPESQTQSQTFRWQKSQQSDIVRFDSDLNHSVWHCLFALIQNALNCARIDFLISITFYCLTIKSTFCLKSESLHNICYGVLLAVCMYFFQLSCYVSLSYSLSISSFRLSRFIFAAPSLSFFILPYMYLKINIFGL